MARITQPEQIGRFVYTKCSLTFTTGVGYAEYDCYYSLDGASTDFVVPLIDGGVVLYYDGAWRMDTVFDTVEEAMQYLLMLEATR